MHRYAQSQRAVERENHPLPTIEDFLPHIGEGKIFTKLNVKNAFHQVEISERSREITTFITRKGLFRYTRLMFGITCAPELFQKIMEQILSGCEGCLNFIDYIIVYGSTQEEHDERVSKVLDKLKEYDVQLNNDKCIYGVTELKFLGHTLSAKGVSPDNGKLDAIKRFREPITAEEVRSFSGLVNFVGKFIPDLATLTDPLRQVTRKSVAFEWGPLQQKAFARLKEYMSTDMILGYYDVNDRAKLIGDASPFGLGAILIRKSIRRSKILLKSAKDAHWYQRRQLPSHYREKH